MDRQAFVTSIEAEHGATLQRFLASRLRDAFAADLPDLVQEVFLRLLRVPQPERIRNPEAYLLTVAKHVLFEHRARCSRTAGAVDIAGLLQELESDPDRGPEAIALTAERVAALNDIMDQLPWKARSALVLHRVEGYTLEQIGNRLGVSRSMAKKYLVRALVQCRRATEAG